MASFGDEAETITIRRVVTDPDEIVTARREQAGRIAAGQALAANPRLGLVPKAANLIGAGQVDSRAVAVLAAMTGQHSLRIVDFPVVPGEDAGAPRRLIAVAAVDGKPVAARRIGTHRTRHVAARPAAAVPADRRRAEPAGRQAGAADPVRRARQYRPVAALSGP